MNDIIASMRDLGLLVDHVKLTGEIVRVPTEDKPRKKNGWYVGREYNGRVFCTFGRWDTGETCKYPNGGTQLSDDERETMALLARLAAQARKRELEKAAQRARDLVLRSEPADSHPYMAAKGVSGQVLVDGDAIVVPMVDRNGEVVNCQRIFPDGSKRFLSGGRVRGCAHIIKGGDLVCLCEGWATGRTIHEATGATVVVAFNAGNLSPVAKITREKYPGRRIIVCCDNDHARKGGNIGVEKGKQAAKAIGAVVRVPEGSGTDYNDMAAELGLSAVRDNIMVPDNIATIEDVKDDDDITLHLPDDIVDPGGLISLGMAACAGPDMAGIRQYSFPLVLSVIANAIAGKIRFGQVWPNLYNIKVGGTSTGKTDSDKIIRAAIRYAGIQDFYGPTDFSSGPGLLRGLAINPQCLVNLDEITYLFKRFDKPDAISQGKIAVLLELHTNAGQEIIKPYGDGKKTIVINEPCVNVIGNATPVIFDDIRPEDFETGLIQRFDFWAYGGPIPQRKPASGGGNDSLDKFIAGIKALVDSPLPGSDLQRMLGSAVPVTPDKECYRLLEEYSRNVIDEANRQDGAGPTGIVSRKYHAAIKYAMIHMASRGEMETMGGVDIRWGIRLADIMAAWKLSILSGKVSQGSFHRDCEIFKDAIRAALKAGIKRPTGAVLAQRRARIKQLKPREFDDVVRALTARNEIIVDESGRSTVYHLAKNTDCS